MKIKRLRAVVLAVCLCVLLAMPVLLSNMIVTVSTTDIGVCSSASITPCTSSIPSGWTIIAEDIAVEWDDTYLDDNLRESIYSKIVGDWEWFNFLTGEDVLLDEIELRRLVRNDIDEYHDAILILPMMFADANAVFHWEDYYTGEQLNNPADMFVYPYVEAGFDVYCLSTRDHNVPVEFQHDPDSWSLMMQWGAEEYLSDINEAVELIKVISGFDRIYLNTQEIGTALGMMYAVEHEENLKGIVAISGGTGGRLDKPPLLPTALPPQIPIEDLALVYEYLTSDPTYATVSAFLPFVHQYYYDAFKYPVSEDIAYTPFGEISWFMTLGYLTGFGGTGDPVFWEFTLLDVLRLPLEPGTLSAGMKITAIELFISYFLGTSLFIPGISLEAIDWLGLINSAHGFYPWRVLVEIQHMSAVENSEYLELDWDDHFDEIDIPILTFVDTLAVNWWDQADYSSDTFNPDNTVYIMENQGVPDLLLGVQYRELVIYPSIQWILDSLSPNNRPIAHAAGPIQITEGTEVMFDASGSSDPDNDELMYRWNFDGSWNEWSSSLIAEYTWYDDYSGVVVLEVSDGSLSDTDTVDVTVNNVAPTASINSIDQPTPDFILPTDVLTFAGSFTDLGILDTHRIEWDFGDGEHGQGESATHSYSSAGVFTVTLTITDDDGGIGTATVLVTVSTSQDATSEIRDYVLSLPEEAYWKNPVQRGRALTSKLDAIITLIDGGYFTEAIDKLQSDIRPKVDGLPSPKDWVIDAAAQEDLCRMIDALIAYLTTLI